MLVTAINEVTPATASAATDASSATVSYDAFLQLLVAEMKNQDPTQPTDPAQSLSQLASFSNVEQSIKMNAKLDSLMAVSAIGQADALIGKTVTSADGKISGVVKSIDIYSDGAVAVLENGDKIVLGPGIKIS
jgi:flagellar basal-body rod modification protein FlgD